MNNRKLKIKEKECYELDKRLIVIKIRTAEEERKKNVRPRKIDNRK